MRGQHNNTTTVYNPVAKMPAPRVYYDPDDLALNDYIVVLCPKRDDDECCFEVPGTNGATVWVARVKECSKDALGTYKLVGWFLMNGAKDLTAPFEECPDAEPIDFEHTRETPTLVGVYEPEEGFRLTAKNVKQLAKYINGL